MRRTTLEIGSGKDPVEGCLHVDRHIYPGVDCVADALALPFKSGAFREVIASHIIEHISWRLATETLREWWRVLHIGGSMQVQTHDFALVCEYYRKGGKAPDKHSNPQQLMGVWVNRILFWWAEESERIENIHKAVFDFSYLRRCLEEAGFSDVRRLDVGQTRAYRHGLTDMLVEASKP